MLAELNVETSAFVIVQSMKSMHEMTWQREEPLSQIEVFDMAFVTLLRGIATIKGITYIDEFMKKRIGKTINSQK